MANLSLRTSLLTIRARLERGSDPPLRATIRTADNVEVGYDNRTTVTTPEAGGELVRRWLQRVLDADSLATRPR